MTRALAALLAALLAVVATPASAQETGDRRDWTLSLSGGATALGGEDDQPFASVSIAREFGDSYASASATVVDSGDDDAPAGVLPARTILGALTAGRAWGSLTAEVHGSLGTRDFRRGSFRGPGGRPIALDSDGSIAAAGLTLSYDVAAGARWFVSPFGSLGYNRLDILRLLTVPGRDPVVRRDREDGVTGTTGLTVQRMLGASGRRSAALYGAFVTTSNNASSSRGAAPVGSARVGRLTERAGSSDSWIEYGGSVGLGLSGRVTLDLSAIRTEGFELGESTSFAAGLSFSF